VDALKFAKSTRNISSRATTPSSVAWAIPTWPKSGVAGAEQQTGNIAPIIQDIVSQGGWVSGRALAIIITGTTGTRPAESYDGKKSAAPLLHVEYTN
jgi:hypothetical protein